MLYVKHSIDRWVIHYNRSSQKRFINALLNDFGSLLKFIGIIVSIILLVVWSVKKSLKRAIQDPVLKIIQPLLKQLAQKGWHKDPKESMQNFLDRVDYETAHLSRLYHENVYAASDKHNLKKLSLEVKHLVESIKRT